MKQLFYFVFNSTYFFSGLLNSFEEPNVNDCQPNVDRKLKYTTKKIYCFSVSQRAVLNVTQRGLNNTYDILNFPYLSISLTNEQEK